MRGDEAVLTRAGFWRRVGAFVIDCLVVLIPATLLAGILFQATDGQVYFESPPFNFNQCKSLTSYPQGLNPAPPANSNFATRCSIYSISGMTANRLIVGKNTIENNYTKTETRGYPLNTRNELVTAMSLDLGGPAQILVVVYIITIQAIYGRSLGQKLMSIKLIHLNAPSKRGIGMIALLKRYFFMLIFPLLFLLPIYSIYVFPMAEAVLTIILLTALPLGGWFIENIVRIVRRKDPWFDRWSGLAAVIVAKAEVAVSPPPHPAMPPP